MATQTTTTTSADAHGLTGQSAPVGGRDVHSVMNFLDDSVHLEPIVPDNGLVPDNDHPLKPYPVLVKDIRGKEDQFSIPTNGFQFLKHKSAVKPEDFHRDDPKLKAIYLAECEEIYKKATGASRVVILNHVIRYGPVANHKFNFGPSQKVHVDLSMADAERTVKMLRPEGEAGETGNKRWAYLNIWRPIKTIKKDPFGLMDYTTTKEEDLRFRSYRYLKGHKHAAEEGDRKSETSYPLYKPDQQFWYQSFMQPDEVMIFKIADSDHSTAWYVPHASFPDDEFANESDRESMETRAVCFWD